jgi:hypothetical protein
VWTRSLNGPSSPDLANSSNVYLRPRTPAWSRPRREAGRGALVWFVLHEIAGLTEVPNYAESREEWGNRLDLPIER